MLEELARAIEKYQEKWQRVVEGCHDKAFFERLRPNAVAWKVEDLADFDRRFMELRSECDHIHLGWLDGRWLGTLHLKSSVLPGGLRIVKLMQRRPKSTDATGLDHIDFVAPDDTLKAVLQAEQNLDWTGEKGGYCQWFSVWFEGGPEAKLRLPGHTTLDAILVELGEVREELEK